jgi:cytoskeletal protein RodZ
LSDEAPEPTRVDAFGRYLLRERELRGLTRDEVARQTRLAPGVIEALESGDAGRMPPRAYLVGYLRNYAAAVGLDPDQVVLRWQELEGPGEGPAAGVASPRRPGRRSMALLVALLALLVALAALAFFRRGPHPAPLDRARKSAERAPYQPR